MLINDYVVFLALFPLIDLQNLDSLEEFFKSLKNLRSLPEGCCEAFVLIASSSTQI